MDCFDETQPASPGPSTIASLCSALCGCACLPNVLTTKMTRLLLALLTGLLALQVSIQQSQAAALPVDTEALSLIVLFRSDGNPENVKPADVLRNISTIAESGTNPDFALHARLGSPIGGQWLISGGLSESTIGELARADPSHPQLRLINYVVLTYRDPETRALAESQLARDGAVGSVRPDTKLDPSFRPNDPYAASLSPAYAPDYYPWALESLNAMSAFANPTASSGWDNAKGYGFVGVVDSGVDVSHPDLQSKVRFQFSQSLYPPGCTGSLTEIDERGASSNCQNTYVGHGTHVAGLIGAVPQNSIGVTGVCWYCSLVIAKVHHGTLQVSATINGIIHALIRGSSVINLSHGQRAYLGYLGIAYCADLLPGQHDAYCDALAFAERREVVVVAAAGNHNNAPIGGIYLATQFPASESTVVSVGGIVYGDALWAGDSMAGYTPNPAGSNTDKVELYAAAKSVISTIYRQPPNYDAVWLPTWCEDLYNNLLLQAQGFGTLGQGYDRCTGTSMSSPLIAGSLALLRGINPLLTRSDLVSRATSPLNSRAIGGGRKTVDLLLASNNVIATNNSLTPLLAFTVGSVSNRFYTVFPQMGSAAIAGTMLPNANSPGGLAPYISDPFAKSVSGIYPGFVVLPDTAQAPRSDFYVYTREVVSGVTMLPLRRLSKPQNVGGFVDRCGFSMPVPSKTFPVLHVYATSSADLTTFQSSTAGNCFDYDGIEGYIAPNNFTGTLVALYRLYNASKDTYILVPQGKLAAARAAGFTLNQALLGYVKPT